MPVILWIIEIRSAGPMKDDASPTEHNAAAAALGFYYQAFYALVRLLESESDEAAVSVEQLDDVALFADGRSLLFQLKHALGSAPPKITLKSVALWKTLKVWADLLPTITLSETTLHLVTVADLSSSGSLRALTDEKSARDELASDMREEARRVVEARALAKSNSQQLPFADRFQGCEAYLALSETDQLNLLRRVAIVAGAPNVTDIEAIVRSRLTLIAVEHRADAAKRLMEWWDLEIVYSLCGKRPRAIVRSELQSKITEIIADIKQETLLPDFETASQPNAYQPDGMLTRQIDLVSGSKSDLAKAIREEWRARQQRGKWLDERPHLATALHEYDKILVEHWSDTHTKACEECQAQEADAERAAGLRVLRWSHDIAPREIRPLREGWSAPYYVRGSYQVLAINLNVGWHPRYRTMLEGET